MSSSGEFAKKGYCQALEESFQNNLRVIEEQEKVIEEQERTIDEANKQAQLHHRLIQQLTCQIQEKNLQLRMLKENCNRQLEQKTRDAEEAVNYMQKRLRQECQSTSAQFTQELKSLRAEVGEKEGANRRQLTENSRLSEVIREQKKQLLQLSDEVKRLNQEKNHLSNSLALHEQELEGIRLSSCQWEDLLRAKLQEAQKEKQVIEQELSECKMSAKQKLRKQKEDFGKKISQVSEQLEHRLSESLQEQKELRFKLQKASSQVRDLQRQAEAAREEKTKLEHQLNRFKDNNLKSSFERNQKEYEYILKIFEQEKRELRGQIDMSNQEKQRFQEQLNEVNVRREAGEKAVERLKVELLSKTKECDELKKENRRLRQDHEARVKEIEMNLYQLQGREGNQNTKPTNYDPKGYDLVESAKVEDYSKVFTQDIGVIDEKYFEASSAVRSPKHKPFQNGREAQLMKKIAELQIESQQYKSLIRKMREEMEGIKRMSQQDRSKEVGLYKDKANIYWEKANDKEQQLIALRESMSELKLAHQEAVLEIKKYRESELGQRKWEGQQKILLQKIQKYQEERLELLQQIELLNKDREMLEEISSELRAQNHGMRAMLNTADMEEFTISQKSPSMIKERPSKEQEILPKFGLPQQKFPKKLHDLVREKKQLAINGKKAPIEEREVIIGRPGTESQKEVLQKIRSRSKTPPSIVNYAQMKREGDRRSPYVETASQKEVFERLKNRQPQSPEKGVNYIKLRERQGAE